MLPSRFATQDAVLGFHSAQDGGRASIVVHLVLHMIGWPLVESVCVTGIEHQMCFQFLQALKIKFDRSPKSKNEESFAYLGDHFRSR